MIEQRNDSLPRYAAQIGIAANICYTMVYCLFAVNRLLSQRRCQDMLHKHCQNIDLTHFW
ncbi:hypothetical protein Krac_7426 [Ktedonobacter racemifer DSM 44963]|uniref:Uncharacterized protein n=1 Tax=Ktedonobacter racemifer DSM 44963 TaxID=485913 RepID=D6TS74_KTERA|nr:hypothetical protein Krac_7426 [Ktedonobacter racemifer DSM 44963]